MAQDSLPLRLVQEPVEASRTTSFCAYCGERPDNDVGIGPASRICPSCELGVLLHARGDAAPRSDEPFFIVDAGLSVCAVSRAAESLVGTEEYYAIGSFLGCFLSPGDVAPSLTRNFFALVRRAAHGRTQPQRASVRRPGDETERYVARVAWCGEPSAALVVLSAETYRGT
jgi:hypothetical protein